MESLDRAIAALEELPHYTSYMIGGGSKKMVNLDEAIEALRALPPAPAQGLTREKIDALIRKLGIAPDEAGWYGVIELRDAILAELRNEATRCVNTFCTVSGKHWHETDSIGSPAILATTDEPEPVHDESWDGEKSRQPSISLRDLLLFRLRHPTSPGDE